MLLANDDVIEDLDLEQLASPDEIASNLDFCQAGFWISRGMIMSHPTNPAQCAAQIMPFRVLTSSQVASLGAEDMLRQSSRFSSLIRAIVEKLHS